MVNTKHDITSYENCDYQREIFNGNALYEALIRAKRNSSWKPQVQKFDMSYLLELATIQNSLKDGSFHFLQDNSFVATERGKTRVIVGEQVHDRLVKHSLCSEVLVPAVTKHLIYDNGASLKGKGTGFTRGRLLTHLRKYYMQNQSNEGYILLIDYSKFYDNIRHDDLMDMFKKYVKDNLAIRLLKMTVERARIDVSYMTDEEYANCINVLFNSLKYQDIDRSLLTGKKFMNKGLNIGDQISQIAGIMYPTPIDNYVKIVRSVKFYARYMDDSYAIHKSKEFLQDLLVEITEIANSIGITIHPNKTRICKLSDSWRFLQNQYSLTETGRVIVKINQKKMTKARRKLKKLAYILTVDEFANWYKSWIQNHYRIMSKQQRININKLFEEMKEKNYVHNNSGG